MAAAIPNRDSAVAAALDPEGLRFWTVDTYLLAEITDLLAAANWQRGSGKGRRPARIPRPGTDPDNSQVEQIRVDPVESIEDFRMWYSEMFPDRLSGDAPSTAGHPTIDASTGPAGPDTSPPADLAEEPERVWEQPPG